MSFSFVKLRVTSQLHLFLFINLRKDPEIGFVFGPTPPYNFFLPKTPEVKVKLKVKSQKFSDKSLSLVDSKLVQSAVILENLLIKTW